MHSGSGLRIERTDDRFTVHSEPATAFTKWIGALFVGFALSWTIVWIKIGTRNEVTYWLILILGIILIVVSVLSILPRSVITILDMRSRRLLHRVNIFNSPYRTRVYSFAEIEGVGFIRGSKIDERDPIPAISLKNGTMLPLGASNLDRFHVSESDCAEIIDVICTATGLRKHVDPR